MALATSGRSRVDELSLDNASLSDTIGFLGQVVVPTFAKGIIIRRPRILHAIAASGAEEHALERMQGLREKYRADLLRLASPGRAQILVLTAPAAFAILDATPAPFSTAALEKRSALAHFEPQTSLLSRGVARVERRALSDAVLESGERAHSLAPVMAKIVAEEIASLLANRPELSWAPFRDIWSRITRRIVLGDGAGDDAALTDALDRLRRRANWAFLKWTDKKGRAALHSRVGFHLRRAETGSLAGVLGATTVGPNAAPVDQVIQWLFAFDAAAIAIFRALAVLASDQELPQRANSSTDCSAAFFRNCIRESLRLWPTSPAILRETIEGVPVHAGLLPAHSDIIIYTPSLHRDESSVAKPHQFIPTRWDTLAANHQFLPFSGGPRTCPAHHLVPMLGGFALAELLVRADQVRGQHIDLRRLPATLDHTRLIFTTAPGSHAFAR